MLRPAVANLLAYLASSEQPDAAIGSPDQVRAEMIESVQAGDLPVGEIAVDRELTVPTRAGSITCQLIDARSHREGGPALVWFHGGGFVTGGSSTHRSVAAETARTLDLPVLLPDYRLAPERPFPGAVEDAEDVARWLATSPPSLDFSVDGLLLGGDSAGGTLALATAIALRDAPAVVPVQAELAIYPATDYSHSYPSEGSFGTGRILTERMLRWYQDHYDPDVSDWRASPLLADLNNLPPTVIMTAEEDPVRDEGRALASALVGAGVPTAFLEAKGNIHAFALLRRVVPSAQDDLHEALDALQMMAGRERPRVARDHRMSAALRVMTAFNQIRARVRRLFGLLHLRKFMTPEPY